jgi:hypothetical protein
MPHVGNSCSILIEFCASRALAVIFENMQRLRELGLSLQNESGDEALKIATEVKESLDAAKASGDTSQA